MLHFWAHVFGDSDFALRALPALIGTLTVPVAFPLARSLGCAPRAAACAVGLSAASPFLVFYAQENRKYALFMFLTMLGSWAFLRAVQEQRHRRWLWIYAICSIFLVYTQYFAFFVLLAHEIAFWTHVASHRPRGQLSARTWLVGRVGLALSFLPWALWAARHLGTQARDWIGPPWLRLPYAFLRDFLGYGIAAADRTRYGSSVWQLVREEALITLPGLLLFAWLLVRGVRQLGRDPLVRTLLYGLLLLPILVLFVLSPWITLVHERYLCFQVPFLLILCGAGLERARIAAWYALAPILALAFVAYYAAPGYVLGYRLRYGKENWRDAATYVESRGPLNVVFEYPHLQLAFGRYFHPSQMSVRARQTAYVSRANAMSVGPRFVEERVFSEGVGVCIRIYKSEE